MRFAVLLQAAFLIGCSAQTDAGASEQGRGTAACRQWQDAICDYAADRCGVLSRQECDTQYQSVTCKSDTVATSCARQLKAATCGSASASCDLDAVADPEPAARACEALLERVCSRVVTCGITPTADACRALPEVQAIDCSNAIAYRLDFERCLEEVDGTACETFTLPEICASVIIMRAAR